MARIDVLTEIYAKKRLIRDFDFDALYHPPIANYLTPQDVSRLHYFATSAKYSSKTEEKFKEMDKIMFARGFRRFHSGTNRLIYKNEFDSSFLLKVAIDFVGLSDNPEEFYNQRLVKPFVCKVFDVTPCGTVSMVERVQNISNRYQFEDIAGDIFDILQNFFVGRYVLEDIGTDFFMNWGIRDGFGPVLLDFPYLYETDGDKLHCSTIHPNGTKCPGLIDYDNGLNTLICEECGQRYPAKSLGQTKLNLKRVKANKIEEAYSMEKISVSIVKNGKEYPIIDETDHIVKQSPTRRYKPQEEIQPACVVGGYYLNEKGQQDTANGLAKQVDIVKQAPKPTSVKLTTSVESTIECDASLLTSITEDPRPLTTQEINSIPTTDDVVVSRQTAGLDLDIPPVESFEEVPLPNFRPKPHPENITEIVTPEQEQQFVEEAQREQNEIKENEDKAKSASDAVTAKERAQMHTYMEGQMNNFPFENYPSPDEKQKTDMIDYLVACLSSKYTLEPEITTMIATEFVESEYDFEIVDKAEKLAEEYYGGLAYQEEPVRETVKARKERERGKVSEAF